MFCPNSFGLYCHPTRDQTVEVLSKLAHSPPALCWTTPASQLLGAPPDFYCGVIRAISEPSPICLREHHAQLRSASHYLRPQGSGECRESCLHHCRCLIHFCCFEWSFLTQHSTIIANSSAALRTQRGSIRESDQNDPKFGQSQGRPSPRSDIPTCVVAKIHSLVRPVHPKSLRGGACSSCRRHPQRLGGAARASS